MFKYKPPVAMYESKGLFSKLFFVTHNRLRDIHNCMFNDEDPEYLSFWQDPQTEKIYDINTLLCKLSTGIV